MNLNQMTPQDTLLNDFYNSCNSFIVYYNKFLQNESDTKEATKLYKQHQQSALMHLQLIYAEVRKPALLRLIAKKAIVTPTINADKATELVSDNMPMLIKSNNKIYDNTDFAVQYKKLQDAIYCKLKENANGELIKGTVLHSQFGRISIIEMLHLIISINYYCISVNKFSFQVELGMVGE